MKSTVKVAARHKKGDVRSADVHLGTFKESLRSALHTHREKLAFEKLSEADIYR